jgi:two-component system, sensor histidine kinase
MTKPSAPASRPGRDAKMQVERLERENAKLRTIRDALIDQVDRGYDFTGKAYRISNSVSELEASVEKRIQRLARAMSEAKIARRQLQQAIDSINEGFILYDRDDRIVLCNRTYQALFPELADILQPGTSFNEIITKAAQAGVVAEAVTDPQAWIAARTQHHRQDWSQFQQLLSDGRWIQISDRKTDEGGTVTIVSDITHFKRLEETRRLTQMAEQSDLLVRTVASIAQGVVVFDKELKLVAWNSQAAMLLNLPYVDMHPGMNVRQLTRLAWQHGARLPVARKREAREWINNDGNRYPLRLELMFPGGRCVAANFRDMPEDGFVVTMTDVTAQLNAAKLLEQSKEQLEQHVNERTRELQHVNATLEDEIQRHKRTAADLERMRITAEAANLSKTRFLAAASHDLLQPLNAARLYLSALETSPLVASDARELLDNIIQAFTSIETLLSTLLDISKMDAGGYHPKLTAVDLGEVFDALQTEFGALARQKGLRLRTVRSTVAIRSDTRLLRSIVQNLVSNAVKYTDNGTVLLGVRRRGDMLAIEVHDTGPGIAPEHHQAIFEEFRRLNPATTRAGGLGLGLATVKRAASLLGYRIELRSDTGYGARFSVLLPANSVQHGSAARRAAIRPASGSKQVEEQADMVTEGCLVVLENDEGVADAMATLFEHWRLKSVTAPSYARMLDIIEQKQLVPRTIIADFHLDDGVDGIEAIKLLRKHVGVNIPGILVTADQSREIQERAKRSGIEYFSKPVKPAQLRAYLFHLGANSSEVVEDSSKPGA